MDALMVVNFCSLGCCSVADFLNSCGVNYCADSCEDLDERANTVWCPFSCLTDISADRGKVWGGVLGA